MEVGQQKERKNRWVGFPKPERPEPKLPFPVGSLQGGGGDANEYTVTLWCFAPGGTVLHLAGGKLYYS